MRTCWTMPVISFTSSELEDYQLQLVLRSVDQIASQFVHRLFFLAPPSFSSSSSSSCSYHSLSGSLLRTHAALLSNLASYCGPREVVQPCATESKDKNDATPFPRKCHFEFSLNCKNCITPFPINPEFTSSCDAIKTLFGRWILKEENYIFLLSYLDILSYNSD